MSRTLGPLVVVDPPWEGLLAVPFDDPRKLGRILGSAIAEEARHHDVKLGAPAVDRMLRETLRMVPDLTDLAAMSKHPTRR